MKLRYLLGTTAIGVTAVLCSFQNLPATAEQVADGDNLIKVVEDVPTIQAFLSDPIPEGDLQRIVNAGVNAPSAMNRQPWHFTVISNAKTIEQLGNDMKSSMKFPPKPNKADGNRPPMPKGEKPKIPTAKGPRSGLGDSPAVVIISCKEGSEFDAGLACESMNDMANLLGYGTKIASSVTMLFNGEKKADYYKQFQIPDGQKIVASLLIGKIDTKAYDAVTSATSRIPKEEVVTFLK